MSAWTNIAETDLLTLFFLNAAWTLVGDAGGLLPSVADGSLRTSLHLTDSISDTSTLQTDNETTYTGYARVSSPRNVSDWTVTGDTVDNDNLLQYGSMTAGGPVTITDVAIGELASGGGEMWIHGQVTTDLVVNNGINPQFVAGALDITAD